MPTETKDDTFIPLSDHVYECSVWLKDRLDKDLANHLELKLTRNSISTIAQFLAMDGLVEALGRVMKYRVSSLMEYHDRAVLGISRLIVKAAHSSDPEDIGELVAKLLSRWRKVSSDTFDEVIRRHLPAGFTGFAEVRVRVHDKHLQVNYGVDPRPKLLRELISDNCASLLKDNVNGMSVDEYLQSLQ